MKVVHNNIHLKSAEKVNKRLSELLNTAYNIDVKNDLAIGKKEDYLKKEARKGIHYFSAMSTAWENVWKDQPHVGHQTLDRNDRFIEFKHKWDKDFKSLSKVARVVATEKFLQGWISVQENTEKKRASKHSIVRKMIKSEADFGIKNINIIKTFPPASKNPQEIQLLDETVLTEYFKIYNKLAKDSEERSLTEKGKGVKYMSTTDAITKICRNF